MAGPEDMAALKALSFVYRITPVPPIVTGPRRRPLLRVQGFMVTKYAEQHGVAEHSAQAGHPVLWPRSDGSSRSPAPSGSSRPTRPPRSR